MPTLEERSNINELMERRARAHHEFKTWLEGMDADETKWSAEDRKKLDDFEGEFNGLDEQISTRRKIAGFLAEDVRQVPEETEDETRGGRKGSQGELKALAKSLTEYRMRTLGRLVPERDTDEYRDAFYHMVTARDVRELTGEELRTLSKATAAAGANLVPTEFERTLIDVLRDTGFMRQLATVMTTSTGDAIQLPTVTSHGTAAWMAENAAYSASDDAFGQLTLNAYKIGTIIQVSEELLADSAFDLEAYIRNEFGLRIGIGENTAYVNGDGSGKPTGLVVGTTTGTQLAVGNTTTVPADSLFDVYHSLLPVFRRSAVWLANDATYKAIRRLKDTTNQYLWQPGLQAGQPDTLLGRPIYADPDMPVMAASNKTMIFGDIGRAYRIRDVGGILMQRLNELYAANGQVGFRAYHRTDGKVVNAQAVRYMQQSAT
jgi:HK97 family phage major capsid protein